MSRPLTEVQVRIMRYVRSCERAAETPTGVNRVWLQRPHTTANVEQVQRALEGLAAMGLIERHALPGRVAVYRPAPSRPGELASQRGFPTRPSGTPARRARRIR